MTANAENGTTFDHVNQYDVGKPDDIRAQGWMVAVHNDYRQDGKLFTFWLFTKGDLCAKGEGRSDAEALDMVRQKITF